jgi:hypothetical protein
VQFKSQGPFMNSELRKWPWFRSIKQNNWNNVCEISCILYNQLLKRTAILCFGLQGYYPVLLYAMIRHTGTFIDSDTSYEYERHKLRTLPVKEQILAPYFTHKRKVPAPFFYHQKRKKKHWYYPLSNLYII